MDEIHMIRDQNYSYDPDGYDQNYDYIHLDGSRPCVPYDHPANFRTFDTGATRDTDEGKLDFEGFLSPLVIQAFAEYMHEKRQMPDGSLRASDNWQKGIPLDAYMKSMWRHFFDVWVSHRNGEIYGDVIKTELVALLFNVQGYLHEIIKASHARADQ